MLELLPFLFFSIPNNQLPVGQASYSHRHEEQLPSYRSNPLPVGRASYSHRHEEQPSYRSNPHYAAATFFSVAAVFSISFIFQSEVAVAQSTQNLSWICANPAMFFNMASLLLSSRSSRNQIVCCSLGALAYTYGLYVNGGGEGDWVENLLLSACYGIASAAHINQLRAEIAAR